jgi:hypothetical protein
LYEGIWFMIMGGIAMRLSLLSLDRGLALWVTPMSRGVLISTRLWAWYYQFRASTV